MLKEAQKENSNVDNEEAHIRCDEILLKVCRVMGANDIADLYEEIRNHVTFWHA
jgi:hypothetical protein